MADKSAKLKRATVAYDRAEKAYHKAVANLRKAKAAYGKALEAEHQRR